MVNENDNLSALHQLKQNLKNRKLLANSDTVFDAKVIFKWRRNSRRELITRVHVIEGYEAGTLYFEDLDNEFDDLYTRFSAKYQNFEYTSDGFLSIKETSGKSKIGNYEVLIIEI